MEGGDSKFGVFQLEIEVEKSLKKGLWQELCLGKRLAFTSALFKARPL